MRLKYEHQRRGLLPDVASPKVPSKSPRNPAAPAAAATAAKTPRQARFSFGKKK